MPVEAAQLESHRAALIGHCYRMLGSCIDAEDAVQETMIRAWRSLGRFEERASLRTWLYRIATHVCLDALSHRSQRERPMAEGLVGTVDDPLRRTSGPTGWSRFPTRARSRPRRIHSARPRFGRASGSRSWPPSSVSRRVNERFCC